ncbi:hypothetical protein J6590_012951 [Homalodisca vitripennis]|nr:hypothetical protein J6590_012951 [Homalodisca vitripennis]
MAVIYSPDIYRERHSHDMDVKVESIMKKESYQQGKNWQVALVIADSTTSSSFADLACQWEHKLELFCLLLLFLLLLVLLLLTTLRPRPSLTWPVTVPAAASVIVADNATSSSFADLACQWEQKLELCCLQLLLLVALLRWYCLTDIRSISDHQFLPSKGGLELPPASLLECYAVSENCIYR